MRRIKWGILGAADIARSCMIPAMKTAPNCQLFAIASRSFEKAEALRVSEGFEKAYGSYWELLTDKEIEAVYIPLPNSLHKEWVIKAAEQGKHILCEKPLAGSEKDVIEMVAACEKSGVILMEAFPYLHSPLIESVKENINAGLIGKPAFIETTFLTCGYPDENITVLREMLGGSVYDVGCYNISLLLTLLGEEPALVNAYAHFSHMNTDDFASAYFEFPSGCKASMISGMCSSQRADRFFIYGTKGTIEVMLPYNVFGSVEYTIQNQEKTEVIKIDVPNNYKLEIEQMGRCIIYGESPQVSSAFSVMQARTMDRVLSSIGYIK
ncbi:MAG: Gfo/Idh/MocA family oxidoreductase [Eubacteriales bacterium]